MTDYSKMEKGTRVKIAGRKATLTSKAAYITTSTSGLYYADVLFDDGEIRTDMMICLRSLEVIK